MPCAASEVASATNNDEDNKSNNNNNNNMMGENATALWLAQRLDSGEEVLVLDCRTPEEFDASHIEGAIHVTIPTLMMRRLKKGNLAIASVIGCSEGKERFKSKCRTQAVVCYDEGTSDLEANPTSVVSLLVKRLRDEGCRACLLQGGFSAFREQFPTQCASLKASEESTILGLRNLNICDPDGSGPDVPSPSSSAVFPVEVLPHLYLGNAKNSADIDCLYKNNIRYILNVTPNVPNTFRDMEAFKYMQIPINDHWSQNLGSFFNDAIAFIDEARAKKCGVLVHCLAGISRSVTVTVAYLMKSHRLSLNDAYDFVKKCKPNISPNFNFMGQLLDFERTLNHDCSCSDVEGSPHNCTCRQSKTYFSSPSTTNSSSSSSSSVTSSTSSSAEFFDYDVPPTPS